MIAYAITDPSTLDFNRLENDLERFSTKASMIVYRDKTSNNYEENAKLFLQYARYFERTLLHGDYLLAYRLRAEGVHLKSTQFENIVKAKDLGLFVIISTHTLDEVVKAEALGADMVTFSPVFDSPNKGVAVGVEELKKAVLAVSIPVIALGGILTQKHIDACEDVGAAGFASIRYFVAN